jgi:hypothetical protein
MMES